MQLKTQIKINTKSAKCMELSTKLKLLNRLILSISIMRKHCNIYCLHILQSVEPHNEKKPHTVTDSRKDECHNT